MNHFMIRGAVSLRLAVGALITLTVLTIGCGGGGSSTGASTTGLSTNGTTSTTGTNTTGSTTATTTGSTTSTSTGSNGGVGTVPSNVIVYEYVPGGFSVQEFYIKPDGSGNTLVATEPQDYFTPRRSPTNSSQLAFTYAKGVASFDVYINPTGALSLSGAKNITNQTFDAITALQYSPDGKKLIFIADYPNFNTRYLFVINTDGTGLARLDVADDGYIGSDSQTIVYSRPDDENSQVHQIARIRADGSAQTMITNDTATDHIGVQMSKDLSKISWSSLSASGAFDLNTSNFDGSGQVQLTHNQPSINVYEGTAWSPDSSKIAYIVNGSLHVINANGSGDTVLSSAKNIAGGTIYWTYPNGW